MLQVPPAGPPPSRPALKATQPDPAEAGFPALALLAALPSLPTPSAAEDSPATPSKSNHEAEAVQSVQAPGEPASVPAGTKQESPGAVTPPTSGEGTTVPPLPLQPEASLIATDLGLSLVPPGPAPAVGTALPPGPLPSPQSQASTVPFPAALMPPMPAIPPEGPAVQLLPGEDGTTSGFPAPGKATPPERFSLPKELGIAPPPPFAPGAEPAPRQSASATTVDPALATLPMDGKGFAPGLAPPALSAQVSKASVVAKGTGPRKTEPAQTEAAAQVEAESAPTARPASRGQRPIALDFEPVQEAPKPAGFFASTQDTFALPQSGANLNVRLPGPAAPAMVLPGKPPEGAAAVKETPKPVESPRGSEDSKRQPVEALSPSTESAAATQAPKDPAPVLSRSESLGIQPTQPPPASPQGLMANIGPSKMAAPVWQAPVPAVLHQVENGIRWMLQNASPGAELQLHPEALGRVRIELKVEGGEVHARLWASDPKSIPVLQENKAFLEVSLKEQGLNLGSFDLRQHSNQPQPQNPEGQPHGQFWPTEANLNDRRQDAPSGPATAGRKARRVELIA